MQNVDYNGNRPMDKMIERMPAVAEIVLDNCIEKSNLEKEHIDYSITYYFDFVALTPEPGSKSNKVCGPSIMAKHNRENLLAHPVTISFINNQWKLLPRHMYYLSLLTYVVYLTLLTTMIVKEKDW